MATQDEAIKHACHQCIGEDFLAEVVVKQGTVVLCSYCGDAREAITLEELSDRIHVALGDHFKLTLPYPDPDDPFECFLAREDNWERGGEPVECVIADMAHLSEEIADDVRRLLSARHGYLAIREEGEEGNEDPYGDEAMYEESGPNDEEFHRTWAEFGREIRSRSRFFSPRAEKMLSDIFGDLTAHRTSSDIPVICEMGPDSENRFVWRARPAHSDEELETIVKCPPREIGPPSSQLATGGRMNAPGIPVFYGAFDKNTCVAEVRALVGGRVVVAKFELLRTIRLLDFDALSEVDDGGSYLDPGYAERRGRAAFFKWLVGEISRPVMPKDEVFEHIPTQAMAEYLASKASPPLDGIIFRSPQTGGDGHNLVLFNHASGVEPYDLPSGTRLEAYVHDPDGEDNCGEVVVFEVLPPEETQRNLEIQDCESEQLESPSEPTLRLDLESIEVLHIKSVNYGHDPRGVTRHRYRESAHHFPLPNNFDL